MSLSFSLWGPRNRGQQQHTATNTAVRAFLSILTLYRLLLPACCILMESAVIFFHTPRQSIDAQQQVHKHGFLTVAQ